jgi:hypothetical protein
MFLFLSWLCFLRDPYCQTTELLQGEIQVVAHWFALLTIHPLEFGGISAHASVGPMGDGCDHFQIAQ